MLLYFVPVLPLVGPAVLELEDHCTNVARLHREFVERVLVQICRTLQSFLPCLPELMVYAALVVGSASRNAALAAFVGLAPLASASQNFRFNAGVIFATRRFGASGT